MRHLDDYALGAAVLGDLHQAARIARGHDARSGLDDARYLPAAEVAGDLRLAQAIHPRAAAAEIGVLAVDEGEASNAPQQFTRLGPDALTVREMAGVVIRDRHRKVAER